MNGMDLTIKDTRIREWTNDVNGGGTGLYTSSKMSLDNALDDLSYEDIEIIDVKVLNYCNSRETSRKELSTKQREKSSPKRMIKCPCGCERLLISKGKGRQASHARCLSCNELCWDAGCLIVDPFFINKEGICKICAPIPSKLKFAKAVARGMRMFAKNG